MTLAVRVVWGVVWMASGEFARLATQFGIGVILARLLTPADFGLVVMAMFVVGFIEVFGRCGMTEALIQRPEVTADDWSSVYWIGIGLGALVGIVAFFLGPLAASFYQDERVTPILRATGWVALLRSLGATQEAWLARQMHFRTIAQGEWTGVVAGGVTAVTMAGTGWGVWSLVANALVSAVATSLLFNLKCPWRPRFQIHASTLRWAARFGLALQGFGIINYLNRRLDDALIGRYVGPVGLGYYSRAYQLMLYPVQNVSGVIGRVMFPALSEIGDDMPRLRASYLRVVSAIATVTFPAMLGLLVTAPEVILVIFGPQWVPAIPILQVLTLVGLLQSVATTVGWIYLARARTDLMLAWGVASAVVVCSSFIAGLPWGTPGIAVAYALATGLLFFPSLAIPFRLIQLPIAELVRSVRGVLVGALLTAALAAGARTFMLAAEGRPSVVLAGSVSVGVLAYLVWLWLTDSGAIRDARLACAQLAEPGSTGGGKG